MTKGSISNTVSVKGHIVQDATVEVQADLAGVVDSVAVEKDTQVSAGDPLLYIKHSESQPPVTKTDESGNVTQTPTEDKVTWSTIYAPVSGTVTPKVLKQQETGVGVVVATITPATYSATGTVSAAQQYRLTNAPTAATLTLEGGPAGAYLDVERRQLAVYGPGGYCWKPALGDRVLVLKAGQGGESPCVAGKRQGEAETLGAGEVSISSSGAESGLLLRTDGRLELNGQVMVNGQSLNGLIRQIVLAILGGG